MKPTIWTRVLGGALMAVVAGVRAHEHTRPEYALRLVAAADLRNPTAVAPALAETCQLTLRLVDAETRRPRPGLVRITREDGGAVMPAGLVNRGIGLRLNHPARAWHVVTEPVTVPVPRGRLTVEAISGLETELVRRVIDVTRSASSAFEVPVKAFSAVGREGWIAGNTHLHLDGGGVRGVGELSRAQADAYLRAIPRGDGLDVVFVSHLERVKEDLKYVTNGYTLVELERLGGAGLQFGNGQEHRHNFGGGGEGYGHVMFLNLRELVRPVSVGPGITGVGYDWPPLRHGINRVRQQAATVIWCHNSNGLEDVPNWLGGVVDAQNIFDGGTTGSYGDSYYRYLNVGLKVPFSAGTDWFIFDFSRVYARVEGPVTTASWLAALRAGRTFIGNGPLLDLRAGTNQIGDTLRLSQPEDLVVSGSARGRADFRELELVHNGIVVHRVPSRAVGGHFEAELNHRIRIEGPGWLAIRVAGASLDSSGAVAVPPGLPVRAGGPKNEMGETPFGHTSPIYIEFGGRTIFEPAAAESLIQDMETAIARISATATFEGPAQREEVLQLYREGIASLRRRLAQ